LDKSKEVPGEAEDKAKQSIAQFRVVKGEVYELLQAAFEKLEAAKKTIKANVKGANNPGGVLTRQYGAYMDCLDL